MGGSDIRRLSWRISPSTGDFKDTTVQGIGVAKDVRIESFVVDNYSGSSPPAEPTDTTKAIVPALILDWRIFGPDDAERFFGRDEAIEKLSAAVTRQSLTALVGASGR